MIEFEKPNYKISDYVESDFYGKFVLEPLERGFGISIGNTLRRVMLSSLPGSAVTSVKIDGVLHEFQTIPGVIEDVTTIILNIKDLVIKNHSKSNKTLTLKASKKGAVTAADIENDSDIEIINKDLVICHLAEGGKISMTLNVSNGRGYVREDENKKNIPNNEVGVIPVDSNYSPIERVSYDVEKTRVGKDESYDRLILEVWTNGYMKPEEAVAMASQIIIEHFKILTDLGSLKELGNIMVEPEKQKSNKSLDISIEDLDLSPRSTNCLANAGVNSLEELLSYTEADVQRFKNLGKKSLKEIQDKISSLGFSFKEEDEEE